MERLIPMTSVLSSPPSRELRPVRNLPLERRWLLDSGKTEGLSGNLDDVAFQGDWLIWHRRAWRPIRGTKPVIRVSSAHLPAADTVAGGPWDGQEK